MDRGAREGGRLSGSADMSQLLVSPMTNATEWCAGVCGHRPFFLTFGTFVERPLRGLGLMKGGDWIAKDARPAN
jgi:hypothetical protein